jgi:hypothetical protein
MSSSSRGRTVSSVVYFPIEWGADKLFFADDTCVQEGYWTQVADFIAQLSALPAVRRKVDG